MSSSSRAATLTVTPAVLTVTANHATKDSGTANPTFNDTITGYVNGDTAAVLSGSASLTTAANTSSPVGSYTITASCKAVCSPPTTSSCSSTASSKVTNS